MIRLRNITVLALLFVFLGLILIQTVNASTPYDGSFSRSTIAYLSNGSQALANVPRFEATGLTVEEGTTNLLSANQAGVTTDTTGFNGNGGNEVITRDAVYQRNYGAASIKCVCDASASSQGISMVTRPVVAGQPLTISLDLSSNISSVFDVYLYDGSFANTKRVTLTPTIQRISISVPSAGASSASILISSSAQTVKTLYYSGGQMEQKPYATSWIDGGSTRNAEVFTIPTGTTMSLATGTIEGRFYVNSIVSTGGVSLKYLDMGSSGSNRMYFGVEGGQLKYYLGNAGGSNSITAAIPAVGWHTYALLYSQSGQALSIDGDTPTNAAGTVYPMAAIPTTGYIGSKYDGTSQADTYLSSIRISTKWRSNSELLAFAQNANIGSDDSTTYYWPLQSNMGVQYSYVQTIMTGPPANQTTVPSNFNDNAFTSFINSLIPSSFAGFDPATSIYWSTKVFGYYNVGNWWIVIVLGVIGFIIIMGQNGSAFNLVIMLMFGNVIVWSMIPFDWLGTLVTLAIFNLTTVGVIWFRGRNL